MIIGESSIGLCVEHVKSSQSILLSFSIIDDQNQCLYKSNVDLCSHVTVVDMSFNFDITCKELLLQIETSDENIREFPLDLTPHLLVLSSPKYETHQSKSINFTHLPAS